MTARYSESLVPLPALLKAVAVLCEAIEASAHAEHRLLILAGQARAAAARVASAAERQREPAP